MARLIWAAWAVTNPFGFGQTESINGAARQLAALFISNAKLPDARPHPQGQYRANPEQGFTDVHPQDPCAGESPECSRQNWRLEDASSVEGASIRPTLAEFVETDGENDDQADDDFLHVSGPAALVGAIAQHGHDQRPDH